MKKIFTLVAAMMAVVLSAQAADISFGYDAGAEVVSAYIWRGQYNGGLSFQPTAAVGFDAADEKVKFRVGAWASLGASDWKFRFGEPTYTDAEDTEINPNTRFIPELDLIASLTFFGFTVGATHYYYWGGTPFWAGLEDDGGSQTEVSAGFNLGELVEGAGVYVNWNTIIAGNDVRYEPTPAGNQPVRAYSSYLEVGYEYTFEDLGLTLGAQVGMSPWESLVYGNSKFAVTNIGLKINQEWQLGPLTLDLFAQGSLNPDGLTKENVFVWLAGDEKLYKQRLNGCIGLGFWF